MNLITQEEMNLCNTFLAIVLIASLILEKRSAHKYNNNKKNKVARKESPIQTAT